MPLGGLLVGMGRPKDGLLLEGLPASCRPTGRSLEKPQGMLIAGKPLILNGRVYWVRRGMALVVLFPIFTSFVPILNATTGRVGPARRSTFFISSRLC